MKYSPLRILACCFALAIVATALAAPSIEIRLKNGSAWRGELNDFVQVKFVEQNVEIQLTGRLVDATKYYIKIDVKLAGEPATKTIFNGDIRSMRTVTVDDVSVAARTSKTTRVATREEGIATPKDARGVFVLPMSGEVGLTFRHEQIEKMAKHADGFGPGQIIILLMDSHGGGIEMEKVHDTIMKVKKRHRVIAWIQTAISAAAASAIACDEIYFMTDGTLGAMTGYSGTTALKDEELEAWLKTAGQWMENGGRYLYIAHAMIHAPSLLSYDKDAATGEVIWHNDLSGEHVLSDEESNLVFTSGRATDCGFADGIADTGEELAELLHLGEWREIDTYGRSVAKDWQDTVKKAEEEIPRLLARRNMVTGTPERRIGALIRIDEALIKWIDRAPAIAKRMIPASKDFLEREIRELRKQLADLRKRR
ncbi:MAG: hypothetical protein V3T84_13080 [Phycisphaerales bacterium]